MNSLAVLFYGQLVLVSVPGPTNALLGASGATVGVYRSLPMLLFVLLGYGSAVFLERLLLAPVLAQLPWGTLILRAAAALYLVGLAVVLWRTRWNGEARLIRGHHMFMTTLLNPKTLLTALVLWPTGHARAAWLMLTALLLMGGVLWLSIGNLARHAASRRLAGLIPKLSSVTLGAFAVVLMGSLLT